MTATGRPAASATPTPECDLKCQTARSVTPLPASTIFPPPPFYPAVTRTGNGEVDAIIAAIESRDAARIANLITLTTAPCEEPRNVQPQPLLCRDGAAIGTPLTGIWVTEVEGGLWQIDRAEVATSILQDASDKSWRLHSVYSYTKSGRQDQWMPKTGFFVTFAWWHPLAGERFDNLRIVDGHITALHFSFGEPGEAWNKPADSGWLLPRAK